MRQPQRTQEVCARWKQGIDLVEQRKGCPNPGGWGGGVKGDEGGSSSRRGRKRGDASGSGREGGRERAMVNAALMGSSSHPELALCWATGRPCVRD